MSNINRKAFLTAIVALFAAPFVKAKDSKSSVIINYQIDPDSIEKLRKTISETIIKGQQITIKGSDLTFIRKREG